jgi:uncharacterized membrane protein required for colicin V production
LKELIDHIPFIDVIIVATVAFFIFVGWKWGTPKALMIVGAVYSGYLLSSIYYHLFAVALKRLFNITNNMAADLISFLSLFAVITGLMAALLLGLFSHVQIGGRMAIFDRIGGSLFATLAAVAIVGVGVMMLHAPYEANKSDIELPTQMPVLVLFNDGYGKSFLAPQVTKLSPYLVKSVAPMLPAEVKSKGAVPLLEPVLKQEAQPQIQVPK